MSEKEERFCVLYLVEDTDVNNEFKRLSGLYKRDFMRVCQGLLKRFKFCPLVEERVERAEHILSTSQTPVVYRIDKNGRINKV